MDIKEKSELVRVRCIEAIEDALAVREVNGIPVSMKVKTLEEKMNTNNYRLRHIRKKKTRKMFVEDVFNIAQATNTPLEDIFRDLLDVKSTGKKDRFKDILEAVQELHKSDKTFTLSNIAHAVNDKLIGKK